MNRITDAIDKVRELEAQDTKFLDMEFDEYCRFQELKSLAVVRGCLSLEEGYTVYALLGSTVETFNGQDWAIKVVLTKLFSELLKREIGA